MKNEYDVDMSSIFEELAKGNQLQNISVLTIRPDFAYEQMQPVSSGLHYVTSDYFKRRIDTDE